MRRYLSGIGVIVALALIAYFSFAQAIPFNDEYRVGVIFESSSGLRQGSPVRIAGVNTGKVVEIDRGPGHTTLVTLKINDGGLPLHRDATARIRPRVFLEGGYVVELTAGSPSAPELADEATIPLAQTARPVQFHDLLKVFDSPARRSMKETLGTFAEALGNGGAQGLRTLAPELRPVLRDTAIVSEALQGTQRDDLSRLVAATAKVSAALDEDPARTGRMIDELATVTQSLDSRGPEIAATLRETEAVLEALPGATASLDEALPRVERAAGHLSGALDVAPASLRELVGEVRELGELVEPAQRDETIAGLETAFVDLPDMVGQMARLFPAARSLSSCLSTHVVPTFESVVPDGELASGRPVWQDFAHALVGLASASQNFDGNGHALRYQFGTGDQSFSTLTIPGLGPLLANAPSSLQSRPLPRADRQPPPYKPEEPCENQPPVKLETPAGPAGLDPAPGARAVKPMSMKELRRTLRPKTLRRLLRSAAK
jgi:virulence factor Mce-like protein